jgi:transposase-like protein
VTVTAPAPAPAEPAKRKNFPLRKRTGTAAFHMSSAAVGLGAEDLEKLTLLQAVMFTAKAVWGSTTVMPCPHCGTIDSHHFRRAERRWKCKSCDSTFSVTSNTVFASVKLPLTKLLKMANSWTPGASGVPALQLRRHWSISYPTIFTFCHKLREGLARGFNVGVLTGIQEMDGMDANGKRYKEKRNKPLGGRSAGGPKIPSELLKPPKDFVGPPLPPKFGKAAKQPEDRRIVIVIRQRGVSKGKGACATRVSIALTESSKTVTLMATKFASTESVVMSDEDPSYATFDRLFKAHKTINHSVEYSDGKGTNNNQAESYNKRMRRAIEGVHLNPSNKYLHEYASEQAWREDTRRMSTGDKLDNLLRTVMFVGPSQSWCGYSHGKHRTEEILIDGRQAAPARGKPKGWRPPLPR